MKYIITLLIIGFSLTWWFIYNKPQPVDDLGTYRPSGGFIKDNNNSYSKLLSANETFTGTSTDVRAYNQIHVALKMSPNEVPDEDASTAKGSLYVEFSPDDTNWDISIPIFVRNGIFIPQTYIVVDRYFRLRYVNDGGSGAISALGLTETAGSAIDQTAFRINSYLLFTGTKELGRTIDQTISGSDPVSLTRSIVMGLTGTGEYVNSPLGGYSSKASSTAPLTNTSIGTFTVNTGTDFVTLTAHGLSNGDSVVASTTSSLPSGILADKRYFVVAKTDDTFQVASTSGGTAIDIVTAGAGTNTMYTPGTFTSDYQDARGFSSMLAFAFADKKFSSAVLQWSPDGINKTPGLITTSSMPNITIAGFETYITVPTVLIDGFFRLELVNGSDDQTSMESDVWMLAKPYAGSFSTLDSAVTNLSTPLLTRSVILAKDTDGVYDNVTMTLDNELLTSTSESDANVRTVLNRTSISSTVYGVLVDLSDTTNFPHDNTARIDMSLLKVVIDPASNSVGSVDVGVITRIDGTDADLSFLFNVPFGKSPARILSINNFSPSQLKFGVTNGALDFAVTNSTSTTASVNTGVTLDSSRGPSTVVPAVGDVVIRYLHSSGSAWDALVSGFYHSH